MPVKDGRTFLFQNVYVVADSLYLQLFFFFLNDLFCFLGTGENVMGVQTSTTLNGLGEFLYLEKSVISLK